MSQRERETDRETEGKRGRGRERDTERDKYRDKRQREFERAHPSILIVHDEVMEMNTKFFCFFFNMRLLVIPATGEGGKPGRYSTSVAMGRVQARLGEKCCVVRPGVYYATYLLVFADASHYNGLVPGGSSCVGVVGRGSQSLRP